MRWMNSEWVYTLCVIQCIFAPECADWLCAIIFQTLRNAHTTHRPNNEQLNEKRKTRNALKHNFSAHRCCCCCCSPILLCRTRARTMPTYFATVADWWRKLPTRQHFDAWMMRCVCAYYGIFAHLKMTTCIATCDFVRQHKMWYYYFLNYVSFGLVFVRPPVVCADTKYTFHSSFRFFSFRSVHCS